MRLRLIALSALCLALPAVAAVDPATHKACSQARDYAGCVKAFSTPQEPVDDGLGNLRAAMKQVASRIANGFSLRDSTLFFQPVTDQLALVSGRFPDSLAVKNATKSAELFNIVQSAWQSRINSLKWNQYTGTTYSCEPTKNGVKAFNYAAGSEVVPYSVKGGLFGIALFCFESVGTMHESRMLSYIASLLETGSVSPEEIAAQKRAEEERRLKAERDKELCAMGPWNRYLEENPTIKQWAASNPAMAEQKKKRFLADPKNQVNCTPASNWNLNYSNWRNSF